MLRWISYFSIIALAIVVWWNLTENRSNELTVDEGDKHYPIIFMDDFKMKVMSPSGLPDYILTGEHLVRYKDSDELLISKPKLQLFSNTNNWRIVANKARLNDKKSIIILDKQVVLQQLNQRPAIVIKTDNLALSTKTKIAKTQAQVNISYGKSTLQSQGMVYNDAQQTIEFSKQVNGEYFAVQ